ncbi:hypothetical protein DL93DRAFT_2158051 [Clavulina sp. PMI_390]|nr:hypothetical protein DL93DRAFT_2158051 [Clavulina sp. PMI_390]
MIDRQRMGFGGMVVVQFFDTPRFAPPKQVHVSTSGTENVERGIQFGVEILDTKSVDRVSSGAESLPEEEGEEEFFKPQAEEAWSLRPTFTDGPEVKAHPEVAWLLKERLPKRESEGKLDHKQDLILKLTKEIPEILEPGHEKDRMSAGVEESVLWNPGKFSARGNRGFRPPLVLANDVILNSPSSDGVRMDDGGFVPPSKFISPPAKPKKSNELLGVLMKSWRPKALGDIWKREGIRLRAIGAERRKQGRFVRGDIVCSGVESLLEEEGGEDTFGARTEEAWPLRPTFTEGPEIKLILKWHDSSKRDYPDEKSTKEVPEILEPGHEKDCMSAVVEESVLWNPGKFSARGNVTTALLYDSLPVIMERA